MHPILFLTHVRETLEEVMWIGGCYIIIFMKGQQSRSIVHVVVLQSLMKQF
jgi:hypothetical protein